MDLIVSMVKYCDDVNLAKCYELLMDNIKVGQGFIISKRMVQLYVRYSNSEGYKIICFLVLYFSNT